MFNIFWANKLASNNPENGKISEDTFVFEASDWNDYGYLLTFTVYYYGQNDSETLLGNYRIYNSDIERQYSEVGIKHIVDLIKDDEKKNILYEYDEEQRRRIKENYYSLAHDVSFYQKLYELEPNYYEEFLQTFRDLTVIDLPKEIEEEVENTLLRHDGVTKSKSIVKLNKQLKKIDEQLNVGNFLKDDSINIIAKKFIKADDFEDYEKLFKQIKLFNIWGQDYLIPILEEIVEEINESEEVNEHQIKSFEKYLDKIGNPKKLLDKIKERHPDKKHIDTIQEAVENIKKELRIDLDQFNQFSAEDNLVHYTRLSTLDILVKKIMANILN